MRRHGCRRGRGSRCGESEHVDAHVDEDVGGDADVDVECSCKW